jgi:hypothetical protein
VTAVDDRTWMLRAARGEIDTRGALDMVCAMRWDTSLAERDPELAEALAEGDVRFPDDPRRWPEGGKPPWEPVFESDPETNEAFDAVTRGYTPAPSLTRDGYKGYKGDSDAGRRTSWTAAELMATTFPEPRWAVPDLVAEGLTLLASPPKTGKSWLSLGLGVAIASGGIAFGRVPVEQGEVLLLALEDTPRRLKSRLGKILGPDPAPKGLTIAVECPPLPMGGDERIAGWLDHHPGARLVGIDVFAKVRGPVVRDVSAYDNDYAAASRAKALADHYGVAILLVHHTRKMADEDFVATVSGTHGIAGACDAIAVLRRLRGRADGILSVTGRDIEEAEHALRFDPDIGAWQLIDTPVAEVRMTDTELKIVQYLRDNEGRGPTAAAEATGLNLNTVKQTLRRMTERGELDSDGRGRYWVPVTDVTAVTIPGQATFLDVTAGQPRVTATWIEPGRTPRHKGTKHTLEYSAGGWGGACGVQLELARQGLPPCRQPTVWQLTVWARTKNDYTHIARYCDEHLPDEYRNHITEGETS